MLRAYRTAPYVALPAHHLLRQPGLVASCVADAIIMSCFGRFFLIKPQIFVLFSLLPFVCRFVVVVRPLSPLQECRQAQTEHHRA